MDIVCRSTEQEICIWALIKAIKQHGSKGQSLSRVVCLAHEIIVPWPCKSMVQRKNACMLHRHEIQQVQQEVCYDVQVQDR